MTTNEKIEQLKYTINRYDHYYDSVNNKGNLYLTLNTFILGGSITAYYTLFSEKHVYGFTSILIWGLFISCILSIVFTLLSIKPYLNNKKENPDGSIIYFADVSNYKEIGFNTKYENLNENILYSDYKKQTYLLSKGLTNKFNYLAYASYALAFEFVCIIIIGISILK